jgi:hypothetical protein
MKFITLLAALALTTTPLHAENFKRITTKADYISQVVGNKYCNSSGCWTAKKNGKMTGKFGKDLFRATWKWHKGFGCQVGTLGSQKLETDCRIIEVSGNKVRITRGQGKGKRVVYSTK